MDWEPEARAAIDRAPFFVRRLARRKVEELVHSEGRRLVTIADVRRAKEGLGPSPPTPLSAVQGEATSGRPSSDHLKLSPSGEPVNSYSLTEDQIRLIERLVDEIPGQESRYWSAKSCGGAVGCPLTLVDARAASDAVVAAIEASGLSDAQTARLKGPVLSHHRFKAALAGCPNCCSEPQIKDFALVARARPALGPGDCIQCGACEAECKEGAVRIASGAPEFDASRCVGCGACADVCESEAIVKVVGYDVLVGGRLGRRPRLAVAVAEGVSLEEGVSLLRRCLALLVSDGLPGERLGAMLDRVGWEALGTRGQPTEGPAEGAGR